DNVVQKTVELDLFLKFQRVNDGAKLPVALAAREALQQDALVADARRDSSRRQLRELGEGPDAPEMQQFRRLAGCLTEKIHRQGGEGLGFPARRDHGNT